MHTSLVNKTLSAKQRGRTLKFLQNRKEFLLGYLVVYIDNEEASMIVLLQFLRGNHQQRQRCIEIDRGTDFYAIRVVHSVKTEMSY